MKAFLICFSLVEGVPTNYSSGRRASTDGVPVSADGLLTGGLQVALPSSPWSPPLGAVRTLQSQFSDLGSRCRRMAAPSARPEAPAARPAWGTHQAEGVPAKASSRLLLASSSAWPGVPKLLLVESSRGLRVQARWHISALPILLLDSSCELSSSGVVSHLESSIQFSASLFLPRVCARDSCPR